LKNIRQNVKQEKSMNPVIRFIKEELTTEDLH